MNRSHYASSKLKAIRISLFDCCASDDMLMLRISERAERYQPFKRTAMLEHIRLSIILPTHWNFDTELKPDLNFKGSRLRKA